MIFLSARAPRLIPGLLALAWLLALGACSSDQKPLSPAAAKFKKMALANLTKVRDQLPLPYDEANLKRLEGRLAGLYQRAAKQNKPLGFGVAIISPQGRVLAGRYPDPAHPGGVARQQDNLDYSRYDGVRKVLDQGQGGKFIFFAPTGKIYAVCIPVKQGGKIGGGLCLAMPAEKVNQQLGVSEEEFLALDIKP